MLLKWRLSFANLDRYICEQLTVMTSCFSPIKVLPGQETTSAVELMKFEAMAKSWWDPDGKFKPLHRFNHIRIRYIYDQVATHLGCERTSRPFSGLSLLDIGCGGGLIAEPMASLGFAVTGIDALDRNVRIARVHAAEAGLPIIYRHATTEQLATTGVQFNVVLSMEVIEHVTNQSLFLATATTLVASGGIIVIATLNRTLKSLLLAKFSAEYILRWLPPGMHEWRKFMRPSELAAILRKCGLVVVNASGISYAPLRNKWYLSNDVDVNYLMTATHTT